MECSMRRKWRSAAGCFWIIVTFTTYTAGTGDPLDPAVERGRIALTSRGYLSAAWTANAYKNAGTQWSTSSPDPAEKPDEYAKAFNQRYGLHPAPYPTDGLPMGLRKAPTRDGARTGLQIDCLVCHGGSIGGTSYVGLGNSQLDLKSLFNDLTMADGRKPVPSLFTLSSSRGTVNAAQVAAVLISFRNTDLTFRKFPVLLGANLPELDVPAWWLLGRKSTMYYDGRTDARAVRANMQFMLGELSREQFEELEPAFRDIQAYLKSLKAPKYPFPLDQAKAARGRTHFEKTCSRCHGTYGPDGSYPNKIVPLDVIGTDPKRALGLSDKLVAHYNATWFGDEVKANETMVGYQAPPLDGVWATAPYLHNGSVPTLTALLNSTTRPNRFKRPPSTDFTHYDTVNVGWKFEAVEAPPTPETPAYEARFVFDTTRFGLSNSGHTFGDKLTEQERSEVIEYLKSL
jgi:mono/diheme cytochrome c family protein